MTLVEVIISVVILTMITGALSTAFVSALRTSAVTSERVNESNDSQIIAAYFTRDAEALGGSNPTTGTANPLLGVSLTDAAGCTAPTGTVVMRFKWIDLSTNKTNVSTYSYVAANAGTYLANQLLRTTCVTPLGGATTTSTQILASKVAAAPAAWCDAGPAGTCATNFPKTVTMTVTELNTPPSGATQKTFTLTASVRPQNGQPDAAIPTPLILLGRNNCGTASNATDFTTGLGVLAGTLQVYGRTYDNAVDSGGCAAMNLAVSQAPYQAGITSLVTGGTCNQIYSAPCPVAPFLTKNNPPIADPYASLPPMTAAVQAAIGLTAKSGCSGPGIYAATLSIGSGTCTLAPGVYILHNGISISGGANLNGSGVLLYIDNGTFNANGAGTITLTGLAGSTPATAPYAGLSIWKTDSSTVSCSGFLGITKSIAGVCFAGSLFGNVSVQGVVYAPQSSVANQFAIFSTTSFKSVVAQAFILELAFGGSTSIGTPSGTPPNITSTTLPNWTVNQVYPSTPNTTLHATGGTPPYLWTASGLPAGLTIDPSSGTVSGTPTASGATTVTVSVTDILGQTDHQTISMTINAAPTITTATLPNWTVTYNNYAVTMQATGGTTAYTWGLAGGTTLPPGLSIDNTGHITGNPTATGIYHPTITLQDATGATTSQAYTVTINSLPSITGPATLPSPWTAGNAYTPTTVTATNGTTNYKWAASGLPTGLTIAQGTGIISGTPTVPGTYSSAVVTMTDAAGATATITYSIVINPALVGPTTLPIGEQNVAYNYTVPASGGTPPYTWTTTGTNLPAGLAISAAGVITGTPTAPSGNTVVLKVTDSTGASTTKNITLTIAAPVNISGPATLSDWTVGKDYPGTAIIAANGVAPFTWTATGLPSGLSINPATGVISGTPDTSGVTSTITVTVKDAFLVTATRTYTVTINSAPTITTLTLPDGEQTVAYSTTIATTNGTAPFTWTQNGLPAGLSLSNTGVISGTPTAGGVFSVNVTATDKAGVSAQLTYSLNITTAPSSGGSLVLPGGEQGVAYGGVTLTGSGGTGGPYTWSVTNLPAGLTLGAATGAITGTPSVNGAFANVQVKITDAGGGSTTTTYSITIAAPPTISNASPLPSGALTVPYNVTLVGANGSGTYVFTSGALPAGLSLSSAGVISGTPTTAGTTTVSFTVSDSAGGSSSKNLTITINPLATVTAVNPTSRGQGFTGNVTITGTGFVAGGSLAAVFSNPGITVNSTTRTNVTTLTVNISIGSGAATGAGTVTATNGDGAPATGSATFTVNTGPKITLINPATRGHGNGSANVVITGTGFVTGGGGTTVSMTATAGTVPTFSTTVNSPTQITLFLSTNNRTSTNNVTVTNADGGTFTLVGGFKST